MKNSRMFVLALAMLASIGFIACSKDSGNDNPSGPGDNTTSFNDLTPAQRDSVAIDFFAGMTVEGEATAQAAIEALESGDIGGFSVGDTPKGPVRQLSAPPDGWTGPDGSGWYMYDTQMPFITEYKVRWTPDIWSDSYTGDPITKIEVVQNFDFTDQQSGQSMSIANSWWAEMNDDRSMVDGAISTSVDAPDAGTFNFSVAWNHVTVAQDDYAGNYETTGSFSFVDPETGDQINMRDLASEFSFVADGSGTGSGSVAGVEVIRYEFDAIVAGSSERTGRYYLLSEGWQVAHEFTIQM